MRKARVLFDSLPAGALIEEAGQYIFEYDPDYKGPSISRTLPRETGRFEFSVFPPFLEGLLPEGGNLEAFLKTTKIDRHDYFSQILAVGHDLVGGLTVEKCCE